MSVRVKEGAVRYLLGLLALVCCACGGDEAAPTAAQSETPTFEVLSHGKLVEIEPYVKPGVVTVFDFYADWCLPCKQLNRSLVNLKQTYGARLVVYKLDVVEWGSELTEHYEIRDLPHLRCYGVDGKLIKAGPAADVMPDLIAALNQR